MQLKALSHFASVAAAAIVGVVLERIRARRSYALIERAPGFKAWRMSKWVKHAGRIETQGLVGTDAAFLTAFLAAEDGLDLFVNAGTCGGFAKRGGKVGDVYCCDAVKHHDRRVPIPGYDAMCVGHRRATPAPGLVKALSLKTGLCTTGNSLDCSPTDAPIIEESGAVCKDMEAASLAHAAELSGTPFLAIKVVTDIVDGPHATQDEFLSNLSTASKALQKVLPEVLDYVTGKSVSEL